MPKFIMSYYMGPNPRRRKIPCLLCAAAVALPECPFGMSRALLPTKKSEVSWPIAALCRSPLLLGALAACSSIFFAAVFGTLWIFFQEIDIGMGYYCILAIMLGLFFPTNW